jgi:hypothetical protein
LRKVRFQKAVKGRQVSNDFTMPAPTGGWNARDNIADMPITDAVSMENFFPDTTDVRMRQGITDHVTGVGAQVESLMPYNKADGTQTLFGAAGGDIYNVTSTGAVGAAVVTSQSNDRYQHINYANSSGTSYLCCFNGEDSPQYWDGSSWTAITGGSSPAITGLSTTGIVGATIYNRRMWLIEVDTLKLWFLPIDSVGGLAQSFDLSGLCKRGGYVMALETWTLDSGEGIDDVMAAITSEGQVVVVKGTDPTSAANFGSIGVWDIGEPIGRRCMIKYKGDIIMLCTDGVYALSAALIGSTAAQEQAITYKINRAMTEAANNDSGNYGWQLIHFPKGNQLFLNVPVNEGSAQEQYVMNTITGSWAKFTGIVANCWAISNENLYYGGNGVVGVFGGGGRFSDNSTNIVGIFQQAFSDFGTEGQMKHFKSVRPNILLNGIVDLGSKINTDFARNLDLSVLTLSPPDTGVWDTATWDGGLWGGQVNNNDWTTVEGVGTTGSFVLKASSQSDVRIQSSDHVFEFGGIIG